MFKLSKRFKQQSSYKVFDSEYGDDRKKSKRSLFSKGGWSRRRKYGKLSAEMNALETSQEEEGLTVVSGGTSSIVVPYSQQHQTLSPAKLVLGKKNKNNETIRSSSDMFQRLPMNILQTNQSYVLSDTSFDSSIDELEKLDVTTTTITNSPTRLSLLDPAEQPLIRKLSSSFTTIREEDEGERQRRTYNLPGGCFSSPQENSSQTNKKLKKKQKKEKQKQKQKKMMMRLPRWKKSKVTTAEKEDPWHSFVRERTESVDHNTFEAGLSPTVLSLCSDGQQEVVIGDLPLTTGLPIDSNDEEEIMIFEDPPLAMASDSDDEEVEYYKRKGPRHALADDGTDYPFDEPDYTTVTTTSPRNLLDLIENVFMCAPIEQKAPLRAYITKALHDETIAIIGSKSESEYYSRLASMTTYDEDCSIGSKSSIETFKKGNKSYDMYEENSVMDSTMIETTVAGTDIVQTPNMLFSCRFMDAVFDADTEVYEI